MVKPVRPRLTPSFLYNTCKMYLNINLNILLIFFFILFLGRQFWHSCSKILWRGLLVHCIYLCRLRIHGHGRFFSNSVFMYFFVACFNIVICCKPFFSASFRNLMKTHTLRSFFFVLFLGDSFCGVFVVVFLSRQNTLMSLICLCRSGICAHDWFFSIPCILFQYRFLL